MIIDVLHFIISFFSTIVNDDCTSA